MIRRFRATYEKEFEFYVDDRLMERIDDEWRSVLYDINTLQELAEHLAWNAGANNVWQINKLDGFADISDIEATKLFLVGRTLNEDVVGVYEV